MDRDPGTLATRAGMLAHQRDILAWTVELDDPARHQDLPWNGLPKSCRGALAWAAAAVCQAAVCRAAYAICQAAYAICQVAANSSAVASPRANLSATSMASLLPG